MIQIENTPNPNALKFLSEKQLSEVEAQEFQKSDINKNRHSHPTTSPMRAFIDYVLAIVAIFLVFPSISAQENKGYNNADFLSKNGFYLPSGLGISNSEIDYVGKTLLQVLENNI